nr:guanine nucleotide-binding protein G(I)/G(S)/G(O) subunit gamma-7 isoform X2 [Pelodiscus sinensis]|eukprot:XP_025041386.1 guanine nucleotide-binding protein G(I)/G(S)/G(O) subunit gamma-7 isoform X2 [Pelodiscus sinensis]
MVFFSVTNNFYAQGLGRSETKSMLQPKVSLRKSVFTQAGESSSLGAETSSFDVIYSGGVLNAATFILKEILNLPPKKVLASDSQGRQYV